MPYFRTSLRFIFLLMPLIFNGYSQAETIILTTGEKFTSARVWEEDGKIRFNMNGLIVRVEKKDVAAVIRDDGTPVITPQPLPPPVMVEQSAPDPAQPQLRSATDHTSAPPVPDPTQRPEIRHRPENRPPKPETPPSAMKQIRGTGLKGLDWKMPPSDIPGLVKLEADQSVENIDQYYRPDEPLALLQARLDGIVYGFWQNRLYSIMYWVEGPKRYAVLKEVVAANFGTGTKSSKGLERYVWRSPDTDRMLEFDDKLNTGIFWMRSRALDDQIKRLSPD